MSDAICRSVRVDVQDTACGAPFASLYWHGDTLRDPVHCREVTAAGQVTERSMRCSYPFDAAIGSPSGRYAIVFRRLGTKAVLCRDGEVHRELDRSYQHANRFEFPIAFAVDPRDGRELIAHCPRSCHRIDLEDADSGALLTDVPGRQDVDDWPSRLAVSPGGRFLLSAGWGWHPVDLLGVFDLARALDDPRELDRPDRLRSQPGMLHARVAAFVDDELLVVSEEDDDGEIEPRLSLLRVADGSLVHSVPAQPCGRLMPVGRHHVVAVDEHPRLVDLRDGAVLYEWRELDCGTARSSIHRHDQVRTVALQPERRRFAVADPHGVTIVTIADQLP